MKPKELREIRKKLGLDQKELAVKLQVSESAVNRWERGIHKIPFSAQQLILGMLYNRIKELKPEALEDF